MSRCCTMLIKRHSCWDGAERVLKEKCPSLCLPSLSIHILLFGLHKWNYPCWHCDFKAGCSGIVEICCLSCDAGFICAGAETEEGEGGSDRNTHQARTVSGKWESVVPPFSSRCQDHGIPNYGCKFCTTASCLITLDLGFCSPFFIAAFCAFLHFVCFTLFVSFSSGCFCLFFSSMPSHLGFQLFSSLFTCTTNKKYFVQMVFFAKPFCCAASCFHRPPNSPWIVPLVEFIHCLWWGKKARYFSSNAQFSSSV